MRNLKGITINGEWLGDNIIINANFRAICNLAPFVIQEFAKLVNSIDKLDNAVAINNFYFPDNNTVDIEFSNSNFSGLANLCFHLQHGLPELVNRSLTIYTDEQKNTEEREIKDAEEILDEISENQEVETINECTETWQEANEICETASEETIRNSDEILPELETTEEPLDTIEKEVTSSEENETILESKIDTQDAISMMVEDLATKAPALSPIQIQVIQATQEPLEIPQTENVAQETDNEFVEQEKFSAAAKEEEETSDNIVDIDEIKNEDVELQKSDNIDNSINEKTENNSIEYAKDETPSEIELNFEPENSSENVIIEDENKIIEQNENTDISYNVDETEVEEDKNIIENKKETKEPEISEEQKEEIQDCLSDFYESTPSPTIEQIELKGADNLAMQAMLNEMFVLRDELNKLKNEKVTYEDIFGKKEKMKNNIEDEDADFRIMGSEERINASILDEELFVAGDKLYKWGDTLYLDE